ncbi:MAG: thioredoxin family protein [bacterium]|nr:thioredoxin family protein [bacterium]
MMVSVSLFASAGWGTNWKEAQKLAATQNKPILMDFSGSDWCGWCIKLDKEVFSKTAFKEFAKKNLILFLADFPSQKQQTSDVKKQNAKLAKQYGVQGYPTVLLVDSKGKILFKTGYAPGGAEKYIANLEKYIPKK